MFNTKEQNLEIKFKKNIQMNMDMIHFILTIEEEIMCVCTTFPHFYIAFIYYWTCSCSEYNWNTAS
jgi:hypothetical protein